MDYTSPRLRTHTSHNNNSHILPSYYCPAIKQPSSYSSKSYLIKLEAESAHRNLQNQLLASRSPKTSFLKSTQTSECPSLCYSFSPSNLRKEEFYEFTTSWADRTKLKQARAKIQSSMCEIGLTHSVSTETIPKQEIITKNKIAGFSNDSNNKVQREQLGKIDENIPDSQGVSRYHNRNISQLKKMLGMLPDDYEIEQQEIEERPKTQRVYENSEIQLHSIEPKKRINKSEASQKAGPRENQRQNLVQLNIQDSSPYRMQELEYSNEQLREQVAREKARREQLQRARQNVQDELVQAKQKEAETALQLDKMRHVRRDLGLRKDELEMELTGLAKQLEIAQKQKQEVLDQQHRLKELIEAGVQLSSSLEQRLTLVEGKAQRQFDQILKKKEQEQSLKQQLDEVASETQKQLEQQDKQLKNLSDLIKSLMIQHEEEIKELNEDLNFQSEIVKQQINEIDSLRAQIEGSGQEEEQKWREQLKGKEKEIQTLAIRIEQLEEELTEEKESRERMSCIKEQNYYLKQTLAMLRKQESDYEESHAQEVAQLRQEIRKLQEVDIAKLQGELQKWRRVSPASQLNQAEEKEYKQDQNQSTADPQMIVWPSAPLHSEETPKIEKEQARDPREDVINQITEIMKNHKSQSSSLLAREPVAKSKLESQLFFNPNDIEQFASRDDGYARFECAVDEAISKHFNLEANKLGSILFNYFCQLRNLNEGLEVLNKAQSTGLLSNLREYDDALQRKIESLQEAITEYLGQVHSVCRSLGTIRSDEAFQEDACEEPMKVATQNQRESRISLELCSNSDGERLSLMSRQGNIRNGIMRELVEEDQIKQKDQANLPQDIANQRGSMTKDSLLLGRLSVSSQVKAPSAKPKRPSQWSRFRN